MKKALYLISLYVLVSCSERPGEQTHSNSLSSDKPNFIIILTDDMGYADLGCFGAEGYETPHLDKMAEEGLKMTSFYAASPVCSPSRAGLLTGRDPYRMGITSVFFPDSWTGLPEEEITLAEALKQEGYATGMVGKWHLGHHQKYLPLQQGFDEYFGIPYSNDMDGAVYLRGNEVEKMKVDQRQITKTYTRESLEFIKNHKEEPFLLYLAHSMPHVPLYASESFEGKTKRGLYGDVMEELDWSTGQLLALLDELQISENTLVIFTSDNGPWLSFGPDGGSADPLFEGKMRTFDGGMRVPAIVQWKNKIEPATYDGIASALDIFPTFVKLAGGEVPSDRDYDGVDILNVFKGEGERSKDEILYAMNGSYRAFRKGDWKIKMPYWGASQSVWSTRVEPHDTLLFDFSQDITERRNLFKQHPEKAKEMATAMQHAIKKLGELPSPLITRIPADNSHIEKNKKRLGIENGKSK